MKSFFVHIVEFLALMVAGITAIQFVKNGYSAFGLGVLVIYAGIMLMRLWFSRVDLSFSQDINKVLEERLDNTKAQMRRLELALVEASVETLWVSKVTEDGVYVIETPDHGCFVIIGEEETDDAPEAVEEG
jgi:hypothetical protein